MSQTVFWGMNFGSDTISPDTPLDTLKGQEITIDVFQYVTWAVGEFDHDGANEYFGTLKGIVAEIKPNGMAVIKPNGFKPNVKDAPFNPDYKAEMKRVGLYDDKLTPDGNYEDWYYNLCLEKNSALSLG